MFTTPTPLTGLADYGEMIDLFARTARLQLGTTNGDSKWLDSNLAAGLRLMNFTLQMRLNATARPGEVAGVNASAGMIFGSPEHDTCTDPE